MFTEREKDKKAPLTIVVVALMPLSLSVKHLVPYC